MSNAKIPSDAADCCAQDRDLTSTLPHLAVTTFFSCQPSINIAKLHAIAYIAIFDCCDLRTVCDRYQSNTMAKAVEMQLPTLQIKETCSHIAMVSMLAADVLRALIAR